MGFPLGNLTKRNQLLAFRQVNASPTPPPEAPRIRRLRPQLDLDREVRLLLELHRGPGQWKLIAESAGVSYSWLTKFTHGKIANPGYATLKRLHTLLALPEPHEREPLPPDLPDPPVPPTTLAMMSTEPA